ncbi:MAG: NUDIX hydrolase [Candidatus Rokubacteria bacterium]|nr:NUDIX hydrolase [Candidatus Rokubacteria bacterium]MBI2544169.1 NUDIX hydrolase [Candidatus Rokubacteria bacterium]
MSDAREYPEAPRVGVGAVVLKDGHVLLVRRNRPPAEGKWSIPGGLVNLGETTEAAAVREVAEECGLRVRLQGLAGVVERIISDPDGRVRYHYVLIDYVAAPESGDLRPGSDAADARWVPIGELGRYETTEGLAAMVNKAVQLKDFFEWE